MAFKFLLPRDRDQASLLPPDLGEWPAHAGHRPVFGQIKESAVLAGANDVVCAPARPNGGYCAATHNLLQLWRQATASDERIGPSTQPPPAADGSLPAPPRPGIRTLARAALSRRTPPFLTQAVERQGSTASVAGGAGWARSTTARATASSASGWVAPIWAAATA
jgi:hypothetical protein